MKQKLISGAEFDVVYDRQIYCYLKRAGACKKIKVQMRRRYRRENKKTTR